MARQKVVNYIRGLLQKGYNISAIKDTMLKYGYSNEEIDEAVNSIYNPTVRHEVHLSKTTVLVIIFVVASLVGTAAFFYFSSSKAPAQLLDLKLEPVKVEVQPGDNVVFIKEMSNLGSSKRYDAIVTEEIIDSSTFKVVSQNTETIAIETSSSTQTRLKIPNDAKPGDYLLRVTAEYSNQKAFAKLPIKILPTASRESCSDGIKNQNEDTIDCGGACKPCENQSQQLNCDDSNACTADAVENGKCANMPIIPCCGNSICENGEQGNCNADCTQQAEIPNPQTIDDIKELAKSYPEKALTQCSNIEVPNLKDTCIGNIGEVQKNKNYCVKIGNADIKNQCYSTVAKLTNDNTLCAEIANDGLKDACYMTFVLDNHDYSVCGKIVNQAQRQSCEYLRQLYNINQQQNSTQ
ncbi:MAG: hypothetical protein AABX32_05005 [Nanoarchaeota archaeon]